MSTEQQVGAATWATWPIGARMAIERLEQQLRQTRQDAVNDARDAATEQRWADRAEAEGVPYIPPDIELPGMWENADFIGGETDT